MRRRFPRRLTPLAALVAVASFAWFWFIPADSSDVYGGVPRAEDAFVRYTTHVLQNPGFAIGYNEWSREPLWVAFRAHALPEGKALRRPEQFTVDARTLMRVSADDYRDSGYDRGHLAPNYLISRLYGPQAQAATFRMSNIAPQTPRLNQLLWQRIEEAEAGIVAPARKQLWVITGPVPGPAARRLESGVVVPEAFYRIWLDEGMDGRRHALAFLVPQDVRGNEPLSDYVVTVREVEQRAGLDFFSQLPAEEQNLLENVSITTYWQMDRYADAPARYADKFRDHGPRSDEFRH
jgi:endonuclease G